MTEKYYTFKYDGEMRDYEFSTFQVAETAADMFWRRWCEDDGGAKSDECIIIGFYYDDQGEKQIVSETKYYLEYAPPEDDYREHFYRGDYI